MRKRWQAWRPVIAGCAAALAIAFAGAGGLRPLPALAEQEWNPFNDKDEAARRLKRSPAPVASTLPPMAGNGTAPRGVEGAPVAVGQPGFGAPYPGADAPPAYARPLPMGAGAPPAVAAANGKIERYDLEPIVASGASGTTGALPPDLWRGLDIKAAEESFARLSLPPKSAALQGLWSRLLLANADAPAGGRTPAHFDAVRLEALYRSGQITEMGARLQGVEPADPIFAAFQIRYDLAAGRRTEACATSKALLARRAELPKGLAGELVLMSGYCAAADGDAAGAGLAVELARDAGVDAPVAIAALDALAGNGKAGLTPPKLVRVLDYRLLELLGPIDPAQILDRAEPALVVALALQENAEPKMRIAAAEAAARLHAITAEQLAAAYGTVPAKSEDPVLRRAALVRLAQGETVPSRRLDVLRAALEDARKAGLLMPMASVVAPMLADVAPSPQLRGSAEVAIEVLLLTGNYRQAREHVGASELWHWLPLLDIAERAPTEEEREQNLGSLDALVQRGRLPAELLHRLATVLDATDVNVPIPLWEAASRTPQPATGYLPDTGVLAQLAETAKKKDIAGTVLLALRAFGPAAADGVHIIALGDTIRALRRAGLEADARRLGVEALVAQWPKGLAS